MAAVACFVAVVAVAGLVVLAADDDGGPGAAGGERGFASPEAAAEYVGERVGAGDLGGALEAFAVESMVDGYDFVAEATHAEVVTPLTWLPASSPGYRAVDAGLRRGEAAQELLWLVRQVTAPDLDHHSTVTLDAGLTAEDAAADLAPEGLRGFAVVRVEELRPTFRGGADPFADWAATRGADEMREVAVLYQTPDGAALGGVQLVRYGDDWYVWHLSSNLLRVVPGELQPTSEGAFEATVAQVNG